MTIKEIKALFEKSGLKFAYHHFEKPQKLPYGIFLTPSDDVLKADGINYYNQKNVTAEIYTETKNPTLEQNFESVLTDAGIAFDRTESYIESEKMYQITYEMRL